jgi:hypothetical protein
MANVKHLLKKSLTIGSSALLLVSTLLPTLGIFPAQNVKAATTTGVGTISAGTAWDTGNHNYSSQLSSATNYKVAGNNTPSISGNWFNLVNGGTAALGYAIFNGALNTNTGFTLNSTIKLQNTATLGADWAKTGASLGFVLSSASISKLASNTNSGQSSGLGINGLPNTWFIGRDMYSDLHSYDSSGNISYTGPDGTSGVNGWTDGPGTVIAIRRTLSSGTLNPAAYPTVGTSGNYTAVNNNDGQAYSLAEDNGYAAGINTGHAGTAQQPVTLTWVPDTTNSAPSGYVSGTLTFNLQAQTTSNGLPSGLGGASVNGGVAGYTISAKENLPAAVSIGYVGSAGSSLTATDSTNTNTGNLSVSLNNSSSNATRATENVTVNYINSVTGKKISTLADGKTAATSSTVTANIFDRLAIVAPGGTASGPTTPTLQDTYKYVAPAATTFLGYTAYNKVTYGGTFDSTGKLTGDVSTDPNDSSNTNNANGLTVANFNQGSSNSNSINIYYTPAGQASWFNYGQAFGTQNTVANLTTYPATLASQTGVTGTTITSPTSIPAMTAGYHYAGVKYYDAKAAQNRVFWTTSALGWTSPTANTAPSTSTAGYYTGYSDISAAMAAAIKDANAENGGMIPVSLTSQPANELAGFGSGTPNVFLMYYEADKITANFTFAWSGGTAPANAPTLPSNSSVSGAYTTAITGAPTYTAPTGYTTSVVVSANGATIGTYSTLAAALAANSKYVGTTAKPMTFAVTVSANQNQVNFNYSWAKGTPGATDAGATTANPGKLQGSLPANSTVTAGTGAALTTMPASWLPAGYGVQSVATPDGNTYTSFSYSGTTLTLTGKDVAGNAVTKTATVSSAPNDLYLAARAVYPTVSSAAVQNWLIVLNALTQSPTLQVNFTSAGSGVTVPAGFTLPFQDASGNTYTGMTGAPIPSSVVTATENALKAKVSGSAYNNWYLAHYTNPNGNYDQNATTTALANVVALAGGNLLGTSNKYTAQYDYQGVVSFSYPSLIDFGSHLISGTTQNLTGSMKDSNNNPQGVVVNDARAIPTNGSLSWTMSVAQTKDLTSTSVLGLSFSDSMLTFNGTPMTLNNPVTVGSDNASTTGKITTVLPANSTAFKLSAPTALQVPGAKYQGEVTWILQSAP